MAGVLAAVLLSVSMGTAIAQDQDAPSAPPQGIGSQNPGEAPPSSYQPLSVEQLDQLVAPISLYPDSLVAQILVASTYPQQVVAAEQFVSQNSGVAPSQLGQTADAQPWDPSVKGLVAFPQVLHDLNRNVSWTTQLGNAYYNEPQDVLGAVQGMRQRAYASGTLGPSSQLAVTYTPGNIVIAPVNPDVVYVPYYNPWTAYGPPLAVYPNFAWAPPAGVSIGVGIGFGAGVGVGAFAGFGWGFHAWAPNWGGGGIVFNHNTYISSSTTVYNHGHPGGLNGGPRYNPGGPINRGGTGYNPGGPISRGGTGYNPGGPISRGGTGDNPDGPIKGGGTDTNPGGPIIRGGTSANPGRPINRGGTGTNPGAPIGYGAARSPQSSTQSQPQGQQESSHSTPRVRHGAAHHGTRHVSNAAQHH